MHHAHSANNLFVLRRNESIQSVRLLSYAPASLGPGPGSLTKLADGPHDTHSGSGFLRPTALQVVQAGIDWIGVGSAAQLWTVRQ